MRFTSYLLGSSYYPEQWDKLRWEHDFCKMSELGFNCIRMGEFAWSFFEPRRGEFDFQWMDDAIALAAEWGIETILCTPTASVPPWLRKAHPDVLGGNEKGPFDYGGRKGYCVNSPSLIDAAEKVITAIADHFGQNENVIGWQLDNEPGYPFVCFDPNCINAFRKWLEMRYGTIKNLNESWGTAFWSHIYADWDEIEIPVNVGDGDWNPGEKLDYRRFFSDSFRRYLAEQAVILRSHIHSEAFIFTNWPNVFWSVDLFEAASQISLDATAWDNYSAIPGITEPKRQYCAALHHDLCRCAGPNQQFLISEQSARMPATANQKGVALQTWQDVAHGARGTIFFEWRPPTGGAEQGYSSVLNIDGSFGPAKNEVHVLATTLARLSPVLGAMHTDSDLAIIYSYPNQWLGDFFRGDGGYDVHCERWYIGLKTLRRNIDVVPPTESLRQYAVVAAPKLDVIDENLVGVLTKYVEEGGILILDAGSGTRDTFNRLREIRPPGLFRELAGVDVENTASAHAIAGNLITGKSDQGVDQHGLTVKLEGVDQEYRPWRIVHELTTIGAIPIAAFSGGRLTGKPAVTINRVGSGYVIYCACDCRSSDFYEAVVHWIGKRFLIRPLIDDCPDDIEIVSRTDGDNEYVFLLNLSEQPKDVGLPVSGQLILGDSVAGNIQLEGLGAAIVSRPIRHDSK